jgi:hypothetical protein
VAGIAGTIGAIGATGAQGEKGEKGDMGISPNLIDDPYFLGVGALALVGAAIGIGMYLRNRREE